MGYVGEHLLPGQLGHFFIVLSLVASLTACFSYFRSTLAIDPSKAASWKKLARYAFITEVIAVLSIFSILFSIIHHHRFEYKYAWQHSSYSLEFKYMLACFWEGQEGSFLLWSFWHCILGLILIRTSKQWEAPVMTTISFAQFCLATMIAGIYFFGWSLGSNPFLLLRNSGVLDNAPALHESFNTINPLRADYLSYIKDGNGLNPLLQNYWMVIHPPVLFLGFASTIVPFAFAIAGLWKKKFGEWTRPALPWSLFSAAVLGVGIMMGAKWAYESLTFGGYWAWDPVENASLVPWLVLVAGIHTLLVYRSTGHSLRSSHFFFLFAFTLVLYSTFLTRSGILGDTSVHAFTERQMNWQLLSFLFVFTGPAFLLFANRFKQIPAVKKEESMSSREFWMFIGSLVLFLCSLLVIAKTSLPVYNKVFGIKIAQPEDPEFSYNSIQVYIAMIIALLTAITQYFKYKETTRAFFWKKMLFPALLSAMAATLFILFGKIKYTKQGPVFLNAIWLALTCSLYSVIANAAYIWIGMKGKLRLSGGSVAHTGFGLVLLGILISSSNKEVISTNSNGFNIPLATNENPKENLTLVKGISADMNRYRLTYVADSMHPKKPLWFYKIRFQSNDGKEDFVLTPNAFVNYKGNEGLMANPASKHYWDHDIYTYITSLPNPDKKDDTAQFRSHSLSPGEKLFYSGGYIVLENINAVDNLPKDLFGKEDKLYEAPLKIYSKTGSVFSVTAKLAIVKNNFVSVPDTLQSEGLVLRLENVNADHSVSLGVRESGAVLQFVTLKAYKFPFINILWIGVIITAIGILISMVRRIQLNLNRGKLS